MSSVAIEAALARYHREHDRYLQLADAVASRCRRLVDEAGIRATVQWRVKSPERVRAKLERIGSASDADAIDALGDLAGVRVATYVEADREATVATIHDAFRDVDVEVKDRPDRLYRATHCQLRLAPDDAADLPPELSELACEVQVCSLLAQVCNEIEHGLVYAGTGEMKPEERAALDAFARLADAGDALLTVLLAAHARRLSTS